MPAARKSGRGEINNIFLTKKSDRVIRTWRVAYHLFDKMVDIHCVHHNITIPKSSQ